MNWTSLMIFDWPTLTLSGVITSVCSGIIWRLKTRSEKKIEHEFNKKLENYKAELQEKASDYQNDIQQKFEIFKTVTSQIQDRRVRSNEKEYSACMECWTALYDAYSSLLYSYKSINPNQHFNSSSNETIKEVLKANQFLDVEIQQIISAPDKDKAHAEMVNLKNIKTAQDKIKILKNKIFVNSIFFSKEISDKINRFVELMGKTWTEQFYRFSAPQLLLATPNTIKFNADGERELNEIMEILRTNLYIRAINDPLESPFGNSL